MADSQNQCLQYLRLASASQQAQVIANGQSGGSNAISNDVTIALLRSVEHAAIARENSIINAMLRWNERSTVQKCNGENGNPSGSLNGISFAVKDNFDVVGQPSQAGVAALPSNRVGKDAAAVAALKKAGLVFSGKCNMSPLALGTSTHNDDFGHCYNPLRRGFSAGGSSGGSAAAVAAGFVGVALGTDTLGSVRIPAAFCGIVGFKPRWESVSVEGVMPLCRMLDTVGVLCRSVEDARQVFNIIASAGDKVPVKVLVKEPETASGVIGVVASDDSRMFTPEVQSAYWDACEVIRGAGYKTAVVKIDGWQLSRIRRAALILIEAELLHTIDGIDRGAGQQLPNALSTMLEFIGKQTAARIGRALAEFGEAKQLLAESVRGVDALMLPTCPHTAFRMDEAPPVDTADLTLIANVLGAGAISLPLPGESGLPVGLQLVGCGVDDNWLLTLAECIERVLAGADR